MKKILGYFLIALVLCFALCTCAYAASTSDTLKNEYYFDLYSELYPNMNRPYTAATGEGNVDTTTGSVFTNVEDYCIEGKNGYNIPFIRSFRSNTSAGDISGDDFSTKKDVEDYYGIKFVCAKDGETVTIKFYNESELMEVGDYFEGKYYKGSTFGSDEYSDMIKSAVTSYTRVPNSEPQQVYSKKYLRYSQNAIDTSRSFIKFDSTMKISKPALEMYDYLSGDGYWYVYLIFQNLQGETNSIIVEYDTEDDIKKYEGSDYAQGTYYSKYQLYAVDENDISVTATHPAGFVYDMYLLGDDGDKYYVKRGSTYYGYDILAAEDRYGNLYLLDINMFDFSITTPENVVYTCDKTGITKTHNGEVTELVRYSEEDVNNDTLDPNELYTADDELVFTITKNSGTENTISDTEENTVKYYMYQDYRYNYLLWKWKELRYYLPYKIEFPSGLEKNIEYVKNDNWHIGQGEFANKGNLFSVSKYSEKYGDDIRNVSEYTYEKDDYSASQKNKKSYFSQVVQKVYDGDNVTKTITNTYDRYGKILTSKIAKGTGTSTYTYFTYTYAGNLSAAKMTEAEEKQNQISRYITNTKTYDYLNNTYLRNQTEGDYEVSYTYHEDGNYIPHEITYQTDADTTVRVENILTADKKGIATQNTYENDTLVKTVSYTYDTYGNISGETTGIDGVSSTTTTYTYTYAPDGGYTLVTRTSNIRDADDVLKPDIITTSVYDSRYNLISHTDANGNTTTTTYDMLNRPLTVTYPDGTAESYSYDIANGITTYTAPKGTVYKAYFDAWGNKLKTTAILDGTEIQFDEYTYDDLGNVASYKAFYDDTNYTKADYTYDFLNRPLTEKIYDADGTLIKTTEYVYSVNNDSNGKTKLITSVSVTGDSGVYASCTQYANARGFVTETKTFADDNERVYTYTHDYVGNVLTAADPMGNVTTTSYNAFGKPLEVTYADGSAVSTTYNMLGLATEVTDARGNTTHYYYDNAGRNICVESPIDDYHTAKTLYGYDPNGNVLYTKVLTNLENEEETYRTVYNSYDNMNRLSSASTGSAYIRYYYDNMGNLVKTSEYADVYANEDEGIDTTYTYDTLGRMICTTTPDGLTETADYDYLGRVTSSTDKAGRVTTLSYDSFNNLLSKSIGEESVSYTYNLLGLPVTMTDSTGTTTYAYSPFGELTTETKGSIIKSYTYDDLSRRTAFNVADGEDDILSQTYTYDVMGRLLGTSSGEDTVSYTYDANSNLLTKAHNGSVYHTAQYNKANMPVVTQLYNGNEVADTTHYTYNLDGNLAMTVGTKVSSLYYYDNANRLVHESTWGDGIDYSDDYTYDFRGNRTKRVHTDKTANTTQTTDYTYNIINQLTSQTNGTDTVSYTYDTVGNMTSVTKNGTTEKAYTYDPFNRLATANVNGITSSYTYNGANLRQSKTVNGVTTNHIYDGANIVADQSTDTTVFVRGMGLALLKNGATTQVYGITPRGDVAQLMTPNGTTTDFTYTAYGESTTPNTSLYNPFGYTGEYTDAETGLVYLRNRYYDPEIGIFITIDPAKDGFNWYAYCAGNPVAFTDPWGLGAQLDGDKEEWTYSYRDLARLTDDTLAYDVNTGEIVIVRRDDGSGRRKHGTKLVRRIIDNDEYETKIFRNYEGRPPQFVSTQSGGAIYLNDSTSNSQVEFYTIDSNGNTGKQAFSEVPSCISAGHELIHAYNDSYDDFDDSQGGIHEFYHDGELLQENTGANYNNDEYRTIGLPFWYYGESGKEYVSTEEMPITENMLREEQANYWGEEVIYRNAFFPVNTN